MEFSKEFVSLVESLPRYFQYLFCGNYEGAIQVLSTDSVAVNNVKSPFLVLCVCEKVYKEMSFIGVPPSGHMQGVELQPVYLQVLSDLYSLTKYLCKNSKSEIEIVDGKGLNQALVYEPANEPHEVDLSLGMKIMEGACKLVSI